ncbi:MAG TPA: hypothetical protein VII63_09630, partial [Caulobacteraceae bacterium]
AALDPITAFGATFALTGSSVDVKAGTTILVTGQTTATGGASDARFQGPAGVALGGVNAGEDVLIDGAATSGNITGGSLFAGRDIGVRSQTGALTLASADAGDDIVLRSAGPIDVAGALTTHGNDSVAPGQAGDLLAALDPITAFGATFALTGSSVDVKAGTTITVGGQTTASGALSDARFQGPAGVSLVGVNAGEDVLIDGAASSGIVTGGDLVAGRDIGVRSGTGALDIFSARAGDDIVLRSAGATSVSGALTTLGNDVSTTVAPDQAGDLLAALDPITAFGATFALTGSSVDVKAGTTILVTGQTTATGVASDARFQGPAGVALGGVNAGEDVLIDGAATSGNVSAGALVAGRDIGVRSQTGSLTLASADAGDDIVLRSPGAIDVAGALTTHGNDSVAPGQAGDLLAALDPIMSYWTSTPAPYAVSTGSNVDIRSGGSIALGGPTSATGPGSSVRLDSFGPGGTVSSAAIQLSGGAGGEQVLVAATDFNLSGAIDAPQADVLLFARPSPGPSGSLIPTTLGGPATGLGVGFTFDNGEIGRTTAASLSIFSGVDAAHSANIAVQDVTYPVGLHAVSVFAGAGARIDVAGQVTDATSGVARLEIGSASTDPNLPRFVQGAGRVAMSPAWAPDVIRISGGVGATGAPFADVALAGGSIYIAPRIDPALGKDFEQVVATPADLATLPTYVGPVTMQIASGTLEMRAAAEILQRNLQTSDPAMLGLGLEIGRLTIDRLTAGGATASRVNLYGVLNRNLSGVIPPAIPSDLVGGNVPATLLRFNPAPMAAVLYPAPSPAIAAAYKFNNCVFGGGGCLEAPLPPDLTGILASLVSLDTQEALASLVPAIAMFTDIGDVIDPYTPIEEEPVTNVGGEVDWLSSAKPAQRCPEDKTRPCKVDGDAGAVAAKSESRQ